MSIHLAQRRLDGSIATGQVLTPGLNIRSKENPDAPDTAAETVNILIVKKIMNTFRTKRIENSLSKLRKH